MVPYLKGFHLTIKMWRGRHDAEGLKVLDNSSIGSNLSLSSLNITRAGGHRMDLSLVVEDEDLARATHHLGMKTGGGDAYTPDNGLTIPLPRFKDDLAALIRLTDFTILPLRMVRPSQVIHVFCGFGEALKKQFGATISRNCNCRAWLTKGVKASNSVRYRIKP